MTTLSRSTRRIDLKSGPLLPTPEMAKPSLQRSLPLVEPATSAGAAASTAMDHSLEPGAVWKRLLGVDWSFADADTGYFTHDIHPYPAKFIPQLPRTLISILSHPGQVVWDPFGGSGTTAVEALVLRRRSISTDLNPIATLVGRAKATTLEFQADEELEDLQKSLRSLTASESALERHLARLEADWKPLIPAIPNVEKWFHVRALEELAFLKSQILRLENQAARELGLVALSKIIVQASFQDGETRYASRPRSVGRGEVLRLFLKSLEHALQKIRLAGASLQFGSAEFHTLDLVARKNADEAQGWPVADSSVDLVVTSPPYSNATDYHLYHRFRLFWLGYDPGALGAREIGSHLRHQRERTGFEHYLQEMELSLANIFRALRPGGYAALVVGDAVFSGRRYRAAELLANAAVRLGFERVGELQRDIHATRRSFVAPARRANQETILVLRRPIEIVSATLQPPGYKLWPYENDLHIAEMTAISGRPNQGTGASIQADWLTLHRLKRLTFVSAIETAGGHAERTWQNVLEDSAREGNGRGRRLSKYVTHGLHDYKGKFYPQLAKALINSTGLPTGSTILDPFCGSGTVLLESYLNGYASAGIDLNPLAIKIARAKTSILQSNLIDVDRELRLFMRRLARMPSTHPVAAAFPADIIPELSSWFPAPVLEKLAWIKGEIAQVPDSATREFLEVIFSSIIREVSHQEPRDLRIRRRAEPLSDAPVGAIYASALETQWRRIMQFAAVRRYAPVSFSEPRAIHGDSRDPSVWRDNQLLDEAVDAIVTSPPYATALPYIDTDRLSLLALMNMTSRERRAVETSLIGSREIQPPARRDLDEVLEGGGAQSIPSFAAQKILKNAQTLAASSTDGFRRQNMPALIFRYFSGMWKVLENVDRSLRRGGQAFFVIGDNWTTLAGIRIRIENARVLLEFAERLGWEKRRVFDITVTRENRVHAKNSIDQNRILWFQKRRG